MQQNEALSLSKDIASMTAIYCMRTHPCALVVQRVSEGIDEILVEVVLVSALWLQLCYSFCSLDLWRLCTLSVPQCHIKGFSLYTYLLALL